MEDDPIHRILLVEDLPTDVELVERVLKRSGLKFHSRRVETADEFLEELNEFSPDIVISDYKLPMFNGMHALELLLDFDSSIPLIVVTGSLDEETAVALIKAGATDYVLKDRIKRLPYAIKEALYKKDMKIAKERAESSLRKSENRLKLAMDVSEHGFWDWDMDTNDAYFSSVWYSMFGYDPDDLPHTFETWKALLHPDDRDVVLGRLIDQIEHLETFQMDFRMRQSPGNYIWVTGRGKPFEIDSEGNPHRVIGTCIDITARKLAEEHMIRARIVAEEANRYKNELLSNINHELRTPLSSVIGFSDLLLEGMSGELSELQKEQVDIIHKSGHRLMELITKMLDLSHIEAGKMGLALESFCPEYVVSVAVNRTSSMASKKSISVRSKIDHDSGEIKADPGKVAAILFNLLENAIKFTDDGGTVDIVVRKEHTYVSFSITDTGVGILKEDQERIFEPFVQANGSSRRKYGGAGLGLMLVKEYIKMHRGEITVESEYGKGSTFTLKLPVDPEIVMGQDPCECAPGLKVSEKKNRSNQPILV